MIIFVLDNVRSAYNVGSVLRTCDCAGVQKLVVCGYSPTPDNPKVRKTALNSELSVEWEQHEDIAEYLYRLKSDGINIFAIENNLSTYLEKQEDFFLSDLNSGDSVFVFGNEVIGVSDKVLEISDRILYLPTVGIKNSLNISSCAAVVAYELHRRSFRSQH
jgi:tRNA G18 (ribose-2'-O)-methylase SpoU